jgi:CheY-like chemotaxis protein
MKILVFDDDQFNTDAAMLVLKGHDVTVVNSYGEAEEALLPQTDHGKVREELKRLFGDFSPYRQDADEKRKVEYFEAEKKVTEECTIYPDFDVVLTDLMILTDKETHGGRNHIGEELPLGSIIALLALAGGVSKVAVVTDMNHHDHPASAAFDQFYRVRASGNAKILCINNPAFVYYTGKRIITQEFLDSEKGKKKYPSTGYRSYKNLVRGKDWANALERLMK